MNKISLYLNLIPVIKYVIELIEELSTSNPSATSTDKKNAALELIKTLWSSIGAAGKVKEMQQIPLDIVTAIADPLIDILVSLYNFFGRFIKKSSQS